MRIPCHASEVGWSRLRPRCGRCSRYVRILYVTWHFFSDICLLSLLALASPELEILAIVVSFGA